VVAWGRGETRAGDAISVCAIFVGKGTGHTWRPYPLVEAGVVLFKPLLAFVDGAAVFAVLRVFW
jgi:hypothetical protein